MPHSHYLQVARGQDAKNDDRTQALTVKRVSHMIWAVLATLASLVLILGGAGHPPPIVLLPLVIVIWIIGHIAVWGIASLAARGRRGTSSAQGVRPWPTGLRLALIGTAVGAAMGLVQIAVTIFLGKMYPYRDAALWTMTMAIWLVHGACFTGLLLRRPWSRLLGSMLALGWAALSGWQIAEHLLRGYRVEIGALLLVTGSMLLLAWIGLHLATSSRVKSFLSDQDA